MTEGIIIAIITGGMAIVSNVIIAWANSSKTVYRIDQLEKKFDSLEKKVSEHNHLKERTGVNETEIDNIKEDMKAIKQRVETVEILR